MMGANINKGFPRVKSSQDGVDNMVFFMQHIVGGLPGC